MTVFSWQGFMDEDRTFYSVIENNIPKRLTKVL